MPQNVCGSVKKEHVPWNLASITGGKRDFHHGMCLPCIQVTMKPTACYNGWLLTARRPRERQTSGSSRGSYAWRGSGGIPRRACASFFYKRKILRSSLPENIIMQDEV